MAKKVWITMVSKNEEKARSINNLITSYGVGVEGHFFNEKKQYEKWHLAVEEIVNKDNGLWVIYGNKKDILNKDIIKHLSLLALSVQAVKGDNFPIMILSSDDISAVLPFPLKQTIILKPDNPSLGAKITAKVHMPVKKDNRPFYINLLSLENIGLWMEINPRKKGWEGFIAGVAKPSSIKALGIGDKGKIPEKAVLEYPMRDMELETSGKEFTAWSAKNSITENKSIFIKIDNIPDSVLFGEFKDESNPELYIIDFC